MKILDLYTSILDASGRTVENGGFVSINNNLFTGSDKNDPLLIDGKRLVLPTREHLIDPDKSAKILFHPLSESIHRGESIVVANLRSAFTIRINYTIAATISALLEVCSSINKHKTLTPDQANVLAVAPNCDQDTNKVFNNFLNRCLSTESAFTKIYLKRSGIVRGTKHSRAGIVSFPFYEELKEAKDSLHGVKFRKKDKEIILKMMEFILPNIDKAESYNVGSDSTIAPFMDALMKTISVITSNLNDVLELYRDKIDGFDKLIFNSEWAESFTDLNELQNEIRQIPQQAGNEGESKKNDQVQATTQLNYTPPTPEVKQPASIPPWQATAGQLAVQPVMASPPPPPPRNGEPAKVKMSDLFNRNPALMHGAPNTPFPPSLLPEQGMGGMPGFNQPMMGMQPQHPQMPPNMNPQQFMQWQQWMIQTGQMAPMQNQPMMGGYPMQNGYYPQQQMPGAPRSASSVMPNNPVMMGNGFNGFGRVF